VLMLWLVENFVPLTIMLRGQFTNSRGDGSSGPGLGK
jgi:hypothetical protein